MKASFVELRSRSSEVIRALHRNEKVTVYYRGKPAAVMTPLGPGDGRVPGCVRGHAAFGMWADRDDLDDVRAHIRRLRQGRVDAV